ncbi:MAG: glucose-1-phosphate thymidylyltransferase [Calditrichaeota bacterium]|nr:MAG: glucose-1-phosphate thymidylyltransferase [Calditrichota bacterium]
MNKLVKKGIILAGGKGTRLYPSTITTGKPLLPVYDKPLMYYSIWTLISIGVTDILLISTERDLDSYKLLFGDGSKLGINISYEIQTIAKGIPDAFVIGESFIGDDNVVLLLADNIFDPIDMVTKAVNDYKGGSMTFGFPVPDPELFGVAEVDDNGNVISMEEKPENPKSNLAIIGLYIFDGEVSAAAKNLTPSARGELEILHVIQHYLDRNNLKFVNLGDQFQWFDAGNPDSLLEVSNYLSERNDFKVGAVELAAYKQRFIDKQSLLKLVAEMPKCSYKKNMEDIIKELD